MPAPTQRVRRGVTLLEVLAVIFIAGVGLLALLTLFPAGLLEMAQSIRDDRQSQLHDVADDLSLAGQSLQSTLIQFGGVYAQWLQQGWAEPKEREVLALVLQEHDQELARIAQKVRDRLPELDGGDRQNARDVLRLAYEARIAIAALQQNLNLIANLQRAVELSQGGGTQP